MSEWDTASKTANLGELRVMDNDDATIGTVLSRREAIRLATRAGLVLVSAGAASRIAFAGRQGTQKSVHLVASPQLTEGPFFVDEKLNRSDLIAGSTRPTVAKGLPLLLTFSVFKLVGSEYKPLKSAQVDVWHADVAGVYSDESNPMNHENTDRQTWLRGYQVTDDLGVVRFKTIFPGWYPGRCPHVHFKVRTLSETKKATAEFTSQVFFHDKDADHIYSAEPYASRTSRETTNETDGIYSERQVDGTMAGSHMLLDLQSNKASNGYSTHFSIALTEENLQPSRGRRGPGGPPPGWGGDFY